MTQLLENPMSAKYTPSENPKPPVSDESLRQVHAALREAGAKGITRRRLVAKLEISPRTLDRALEAMVIDGARIERISAEIPGLRTICLVLVKDPAWADGYSHHARLALQLAELALEQSGSEFWGQYLPIFEQLLAPHLTRKDRLVFDQLKDQINYRGSVGKSRERDPKVFLTLLDALATKPVPPQLEILYSRARDEQGTWITVVPYSITHDALAGSAYLLAWDTGSLSAGHFRIGRIKAIKTNGRHGVLGSEPKSSLERARQFQVGGWFADKDPFEIEVEIHGKNWVKAFLDTPPALPEVKVVQVDDGTGLRVRIQFKATELEGPSRWIMQIGSKAKVLSPDHLRKHLEANLRASVAHYV